MINNDLRGMKSSVSPRFHFLKNSFCPCSRCHCFLSQCWYLVTSASGADEAVSITFMRWKHSSRRSCGFFRPHINGFPSSTKLRIVLVSCEFCFVLFFFPFVDRSKIASTYYWHQSHTSVKPHTSGSKSAILFVCLAVGDTTTNTLLSLSDSGWNIQLLFFLLFFLCGGRGGS